MGARKIFMRLGFARSVLIVVLTVLLAPWSQAENKPRNSKHDDLFLCADAMDRLTDAKKDPSGFLKFEGTRGVAKGQWFVSKNGAYFVSEANMPAYVNIDGMGSAKNLRVRPKYCDDQSTAKDCDFDQVENVYVMATSNNLGAQKNDCVSDFKSGGQPRGLFEKCQLQKTKTIEDMNERIDALRRIYSVNSVHLNNPEERKKELKLRSKFTAKAEDEMKACVSETVDPARKILLSYCDQIGSSQHFGDPRGILLLSETERSDKPKGPTYVEQASSALRNQYDEKNMAAQYSARLSNASKYSKEVVEKKLKDGLQACARTHVLRPGQIAAITSGSKKVSAGPRVSPDADDDNANDADKVGTVD